MIRLDCRSFRGSCFAGLINPVLAGLLSAKPLLHAGQETSAIGELIYFDLLFSPVSYLLLSPVSECEACP